MLYIKKMILKLNMQMCHYIIEIFYLKYQGVLLVNNLCQREWEKSLKTPALM